jgi:hypothetical protein
MIVSSRAAACAAAICILAACISSWDSSGNYRVSRRVHQVVPGASLQRVSIANVEGRIDVRGWNRPDVQVNALIRAKDNDALQKITVSVAPAGDQLVIRTQYPSSFTGFGSQVSGSVDYEIRVPERFAVKAVDVSGNVTVAGVNNDVDAASVSGDISAAGGGSLDLKTTSGAIEGSARALGASGHIRAASVSGNIALRIPRNSGADVSARSVSGNFSSNLGLPKPNQTVGTNLSAQLNGGGATISLGTVSGSMQLTGY